MECSLASMTSYSYFHVFRFTLLIVPIIIKVLLLYRIITFNYSSSNNIGVDHAKVAYVLAMGKGFGSIHNEEEIFGQCKKRVHEQYREIFGMLIIIKKTAAIQLLHLEMSTSAPPQTLGSH